jgi:hypothetical protein
MSIHVSYSVEDIDVMLAAAYQRGFTDGYGEAIKEEVLELAAMKREQEREACQNWQGMCESGQAGQPWE